MLVDFEQYSAFEFQWIDLLFRVGDVFLEIMILNVIPRERLNKLLKLVLLFWLRVMNLLIDIGWFAKISVKW